MSYYFPNIPELNIPKIFRSLWKDLQSALLDNIDINFLLLEPRPMNVFGFILGTILHMYLTVQIDFL